MTFTTRPTLRGYGGAVSAGHYLAAQAGARILADGGNAADAACAMGFALALLEPHQNGLGGEVPILVHDAVQDQVFAISGQGPAPAAATIERMRALGADPIPPDGFLAAAVPASIDAWCLLLERFGTLTLGEVIAPARGMAVRGFPMYPFLYGILKLIAPRFEREWPTSAEVYLPPRRVGDRQTNPALGALLGDLANAERNASGGREAGIRAARDHFYRGAPAEAIERLLAEPIEDATGEPHAGLLRAEDLARYEGRIEEPVSVSYRGARVFKPGPWSQGPVFLQQLRLLEGFDLAAMGNGPDALHTWIEAAKLAFADRDACYGDPDFAKVPLERLLSAAYADERRGLIDAATASLEQRPGLGRLPEGWPLVWDPTQTSDTTMTSAWALGRRDTTQLVAADASGSLVCATPSGGWIPTSPVVPELGFPVGTRVQMAVLDPDHPNALAPGKRPRTTLSPGIAWLPDGRRMSFGTPGGDQQDQWTVQFLMQLLDFDVRDLQQAIDAPTVNSDHMSSSFYPRRARPGVVSVEDRIGEETLAALAARGHVLERKGDWAHGRVLAATHDPARGLIEAAASPRSQLAYAIALP